MARICILVLALLLSACETVKPWERGSLAKEEMQWDTDRMDTAVRKQTQLSKEASSGGSGAAGGGCGCN
jgi:hypothetical protein